MGLPRILPCTFLAVLYAALGFSLSVQSFPDRASPFWYQAQDRPAVAGQSIRVQVRMVPVDVIVTDSQGKPVTGLKREDFRIFEDGREQDVQHFTIQNLAGDIYQSGRSTADPQAQRPPQSPSPAPGLAQHTSRTFLILMGHGIHQTPFKALDALIPFVRTRLLPQDRVALFAYNRVTDFTTDREQVARILERYRDHSEAIQIWREEQIRTFAAIYYGALIGKAPQVFYRTVHSSPFLKAEIGKIFEAVGSLPSMEIPPIQMPESVASSLDRARFTPNVQADISADRASSAGQSELTAEISSAVAASALEGFEATAVKLGLPNDVFVREATGSVEDMANIFTCVEHIRNEEGEKHLLFLTEFGLLFPYGDRKYNAQIARFAADARVAINFFQTGGLDGVLRGSKAEIAKNLNAGQPKFQVGKQAEAGMIAAVRDISEQTGGRAAVYEDLKTALDRTNETTRFEYLLGYYPKNDRWDGKFRQIEVKVNRPGSKAYYRNGYYAREITERFDRREQLAKERIRDAGTSDLALDAVVFEASATRITDTSGILQIKVDLEIDPPSVKFTKIDGRHTAKLRIAVFYADKDGKNQGEDAKTLDLNLQEDTYERMMASAIPFSTLIPSIAPQMMLKVVVFDMNGDRIGTAVLQVR
jgi:VWFA-related protein